MNIVNVNGTIALFFANLIGKIFGAIYRIPLSNFLGAEGMGLYQMAFPIYSFLLTMITGGISITLSRKIATSRANNNLFQIEKDFLIAKRLSVSLGIIFLVVLIVFSYPFSYLQGNVNALFGYYAISLGFVFACMLGAYRGYYQGHGRMMQTAISQVIEQGVKLVLGLIFASFFVRYGVIFGVVGAILGVSISELVAFMYFIVINKKIKTKKQEIYKSEYIDFFKSALPVGASYGVLPLSSLIDSFLIINLLVFSGFGGGYATSLYGIETGMILPLINIPNVLISAIAITAMPDLTFKKEKGQKLSNSVSSILKIVYIFVLPCAVGLYILAEKLIMLVYPNLYSLMGVATNLLRFSMFEMFFLCFVTITNSILQGLGRTKQPFWSLFLGMIIKVILILALVTNKNINIYGFVIASVIGYFVSCCINIIQIKKETSFSLRIGEIFAPIFSSAIMGILLVFLINNINLNIISGIVSIIISAVIYFVLLALFGQLKLKQVKNMLQKSLK